MKQWFVAKTEKGLFEIQIYAETEPQAEKIAVTSGWGNVRMLDQANQAPCAFLGVTPEDFANIYPATLDAIAQTQRKLLELQTLKDKFERAAITLSEKFPIIIGEFIIDVDEEGDLKSIKRIAKKF